MKIETILNRIDGKEKAIDRLIAKIDRIEMAKASNWVKNPYYYTESDLTSAYKDLDTERKSLKKYEDMLSEATEKANSRNVKVLVDFLEAWKKDAIEWLLKQKEAYEDAKTEYRKAHAEYMGKLREYKFRSLEYNEVEKNWKEYSKAFNERWSHVTQFNHGTLSWEETMRKDIEEEKNRKYDDIIERTNKIVDEITDASYLKINAKGNLDGYIIGTRGKANVWTIEAGGYNIQRLHFRTLIQPRKED